MAVRWHARPRPGVSNAGALGPRRRTPAPHLAFAESAESVAERKPAVGRGNKPTTAMVQHKNQTITVPTELRNITEAAACYEG